MDSMERDVPAAIALRSAFLALTAVVAAGCAPNTEGDARHGQTPRPELAAQVIPNRPDALQAIEGLACKPPTNGIYNCSAAGFDVSGSQAACDAGSASFGRISASDVALAGTLNQPADATSIHLKSGQWVCVQYSADSASGEQSRLYVTAIPAPLVTNCTAHRDCGSDDTPLRGNARCRIDKSHQYTKGCATGWIPEEAVIVYSMGLNGQYAERASVSGRTPNQTEVINHPTDFKRYSTAAMNGGICIVGARLDDLGQQQAVVTAQRSDGSRLWTTDLPKEPAFYENRATHCTCGGSACYVAVATDTQAAQTLSQTLLSIVKVDVVTGAILGERSIHRVPGVANARSIWMDSSDVIVIKDAGLDLHGRWRTSSEDPAQAFQAKIPLF
jgi:hypothetical protein